jgi:outer membrane lipoprotein-sorting protein
MHRTRTVLASTFFSLMLAVGASAQGAAPPAAPAQAKAALPTVDDIIARNLQAKGGAEKWQAIKSVKMTGKMAAQGTEMPLTVYAMRPNFNRQEITLPAGKAIQAFDGTSAWVVNPTIGIDTPQPVPGPAGDLAKNSADFDGALLNYKAKGNTIDLVGKEKLDGKDVYHLKVTMKGGPVQDYLLDAESGIELRMSAIVDLPNGQKQTLTTEMSNYKQVNGIMIPHTVTQMSGAQRLLQWTIDTVEFNTVPDDSIFRMPKK